MRHPVESGRCAALARVVFRVAEPRDPDTEGRIIRPKNAARFVVPKHPHPPRWASHTLVHALDHHVDALTGADGTAAQDYLERHWEYADCLRMDPVDVFTVDPGIEDDL